MVVEVIAQLPLGAQANVANTATGANGAIDPVPQIVAGTSTVGPTATWRVTLSPAQASTLKLDLIAPANSGSYTVLYTVNLVTLNGTGQVVTRSFYSNATQSFTVRAQDQLQLGVVQQLQALTPQRASERAKQAQAVSYTTAALANVAQGSVGGSAQLGAGPYIEAIANYLRAAEALRAITSVDVQAPLSALARLLEQAQLLRCNTLPQCTATTPSLVSETLFTPFGAGERLIARGGRPGSSGWEWALGVNTLAASAGVGSGSNFTAQNRDWVSGKTYGWTLTYTGQGGASLVVRDAQTNASLFSTTYVGGTNQNGNPAGLRTGNALQFAVQANEDACYATSAAQAQATVVTLEGQALNASLTQALALTTPARSSDQDEDGLRGASQVVFWPSLTDGFTATGTVKLLFQGSAPPRDGRLSFTVNAGNAVCR